MQFSVIIMAFLLSGFVAVLNLALKNNTQTQHFEIRRAWKNKVEYKVKKQAQFLFSYHLLYNYVLY